MRNLIIFNIFTLFLEIIRSTTNDEQVYENVPLQPVVTVVEHADKEDKDQLYENEPFQQPVPSQEQANQENDDIVYKNDSLEQVPTPEYVDQEVYEEWSESSPDVLGECQNGLYDVPSPEYVDQEVYEEWSESSPDVLGECQNGLYDVPSDSPKIEPHTYEHQEGIFLSDMPTRRAPLPNDEEENPYEIPIPLEDQNIEVSKSESKKIKPNSSKRIIPRKVKSDSCLYESNFPKIKRSTSMRSLKDTMATAGEKIKQEGSKTVKKIKKGLKNVFKSKKKKYSLKDIKTPHRMEDQSNEGQVSVQGREYPGCSGQRENEENTEYECVCFSSDEFDSRSDSELSGIYENESSDDGSHLRTSPDSQQRRFSVLQPPQPPPIPSYFKLKKESPCHPIQPCQPIQPIQPIPLLKIPKGFKLRPVSMDLSSSNQQEIGIPRTSSLRELVVPTAPPIPPPQESKPKLVLLPPSAPDIQPLKTSSVPSKPSENPFGQRLLRRSTIKRPSFPPPLPPPNKPKAFSVSQINEKTSDSKKYSKDQRKVSPSEELVPKDDTLPQCNKSQDTSIAPSFVAQEQKSTSDNSFLSELEDIFAQNEKEEQECELLELAKKTNPEFQPLLLPPSVQLSEDLFSSFDFTSPQDDDQKSFEALLLTKQAETEQPKLNLLINEPGLEIFDDFEWPSDEFEWAFDEFDDEQL
ncbi:hypothetical protein M153_12800010496 [Pseudoloma neurophilia]|uniref:Uncharacterized protein n=1 Tax=Pseudoloma neurophilia TaxID=146866 RepID=A0A0R0M7C1_9MICR|nr:hypothetical protein M153_12800010496 [Pseudoloma neurophilia]